MIFRSTLFALLLVLTKFSVRVAGQCGAGKYCSGEFALANLCETCPAGYYCPGQSGSCINCNCWGISSSSSDNAPKLACPAGKYSSSSASSCTSCPAGKYSSSTTSSSCTSCLSGKYSTTTGASSSSTCQTCPAGLNSYSGSSFCITLVHNWDFRGCTQNSPISDSSPGR